MATPVFRFAPSPNGQLHLGHAASALLNARMARDTGGRFLLRIEDIDVTRCKPAFDKMIEDDLAWLGLEWEKPVMRQSTRWRFYAEALDKLDRQGLTYPCFCSRKEIAIDSQGLGHDPDGALLYSGQCLTLDPAEVKNRLTIGEPFALRLRMDEALKRLPSRLTWREGAPGRQPMVFHAEPEKWGDVVLRRKEFPASYHLAVVLDDAAQGVTHVVRGQDLFAATAVHRLVQVLLGLPEPLYYHHDLLRDENGSKLSKSLGSRSLADLRRNGMTREQVLEQASLKI